MDAAQLELGRGEGVAGAGSEVVVIHPELARTAVVDDPGRLGRVGRERPPEQDRHPPVGCRSDRLEPVELARRLDGDQADPRLNGRAQLLVPLARAR